MNGYKSKLQLFVAYATLCISAWYDLIPILKKNFAKNIYD